MITCILLIYFLHTVSAKGICRKLNYWLGEVKTNFYSVKGTSYHEYCNQTPYFRKCLRLWCTMQSRIYDEKKTYFLEQYEKLHFCHIILIYLGPEIVYFHQIHISVTFSNRELEFILRNSIWNLLIFMRTLLILHSHVPCYGVHMIHMKNCQILSCDITNYYSKIILAQSLNCGKRTHARKNVNFSYL